MRSQHHLAIQAYIWYSLSKIVITWRWPLLAETCSYSFAIKYHHKTYYHSCVSWLKFTSPLVFLHTTGITRLRIVMSQLNPLHSLLSYLLTVHLCIIICFHLSVTGGPSHFQVFQPKPYMHVFSASACYMYHLSQIDFRSIFPISHLYSFAFKSICFLFLAMCSFQFNLQPKCSPGILLLLFEVW